MKKFYFAYQHFCCLLQLLMRNKNLILEAISLNDS